VSPVVRVTEGALAVGDRIRFHGHTTDFTEQVASMEVKPSEGPAGEGGRRGRHPGGRPHAPGTITFFKVTP